MKKQWISVKCGLSRDPKHRRQMGKSIWTFLHMLDLADWETGVVYDWKDEDAAEDMGIDIRVLREDRRKLDEEDYISCRQKQYGQDITIHNWTNPREYTGDVYNKKQGDKKLPPSEIQGYAQGYAQGSVKDVTPTSDSKIKDQPSILSAQDYQEVNAKVDFMLDTARQADTGKNACMSFELAMLGGSVGWPWGSNAKWQKFAKWVAEQDQQLFTDYAKWRKGEGKYHAMSNNKIRQDPQMFIDTGWPTFLAHVSMYGESDKTFML